MDSNRLFIFLQDLCGHCNLGSGDHRRGKCDMFAYINCSTQTVKSQNVMRFSVCFIIPNLQKKLKLKRSLLFLFV